MAKAPAISLDEAPRVLAAVRGKEATMFQVVRSRVSASPGMLAALDIAMLDIAARFAKIPVYRYLGGPTRNKARALARLEGSSDAELLASVRRAREAGFRAFLVPAPAEAAQSSKQAFVQVTRKRLDALRSAAGEGTDFVLDAAASLTPGDAALLAADLQMFYLMWFDEPCPVSNLAAVKKISSENVTPLGFGRHIREAGIYQELLREDSIDVLRPDISLTGISEIRKVAAMAETYYVAVAPYHDGGPIASAAAIHLAASLPNFVIQQFPFPGAEEDRRMRAALTGGPVVNLSDGFATLLTGAGLGISVDEKALEQYRERAA